jgi:putative restriction endonuclease
MTRKNWTREETIIAFNVYCKIPFKSSSKSNPIVVKYAKLIGRSPSALNMKVGNFGRLDPELKRQGIVGLAHGSKIEEEIWDEFNGDWERLAFESEELIAKFSNRPVEEVLDIETKDIREGIEREAVVKQRVNQNFFRSTVLSAYYYKCCITGLSVPDFLIASHIIPWSKNKEHRVNPRNGLCLNSIHDKAFDRGFITITPEFRIKVSKVLGDFEMEKAVQEFFLKYENQKISLPDKFIPTREFLDYHYSNIFQR